MNPQTNPTVHIEVIPNKGAEVRIMGAPMPEVIRLCLLGIETTVKRCLDEAAKTSEEFREDVAADLFELINAGASTLLSRCFPEIEMRPDITVEAIMNEEDRIMREEPEKVKAAHEAYINSADARKDKAITEHNVAALKEQKKQVLNIADHKKPKKN